MHHILCQNTNIQINFYSNYTYLYKNT